MNTIQNLKEKLKTPGEFTNITIGTNQEIIQVNTHELYESLPKYYIVNKTVNMRTGAGLTAPVLTTISANNILEIRGFNPIKLNGYNWVNAKWGEYDGWVASEFLNEINPTKPQLDVPYIRQEGTGAMQFRNDCGCACVAMLLKYHLNLSISVDQLSRDTSLVQNDNGLYTYQLVNLAVKYGWAAVQNNDMSIDIIKHNVDAKRPPVMLINYRYITKRQNQNDLSQHFVVVTGYDDDNIFINDPDFWYPNEELGHNMRVPNIQFQNAIYYASPRYQGLI